jgi:imidazolonepropionase
MLEADFALFNVDRLVTVAPNSHPTATGELGVIQRGALAAREHTIVWVGPMDELYDNVRLSPDATIVNTHGRTVLPGFVDPHTHPIFAGDRVEDFYARAAGRTYSEQLQSGGIMRTITATREKSEDTLLDLAFQRADTFLQYGTTTIEGKTGYGLTRDDELKSLRVLNRLQHIHPLKIVPAFLGAHVVPADFGGDAEAYLDELIEHWLPLVRDRAQIVDVWCDDGAFTAAQGQRLLQRAREMGFSLTAHANELGPHGGARMAAEMGALSVDHAVYLDDEDIATLRDNGTVAVLLPGTTFFLGSDRYAPARRLIDAGVRVALGTDFNPGTSPTASLPLAMTVACLSLDLSPEEALTAVTINAAAAVGLADEVGSIETGKVADVAVWRVPRIAQIPYWPAADLVRIVIKRGRVAFEAR